MAQPEKSGQIADDRRPEEENDEFRKRGKGFAVTLRTV